MQIQYHQSKDYGRLQHIDKFTSLTLEERTCLNRIGSYLLESRGNEKFGISLLHRHFLVTDDELMFETTCQKQRITKTRPISKNEIVENLRVQVKNFRFRENSLGFEYIGLEYTLHDGNNYTDVLETNLEHLHLIYCILQDYDCVDRFGVVLRDDTLEIAQDEALIETCDLEKRELLCRVVKKNEDCIAKAIETQWVWKFLPENAVRQICSPETSQVCQSWCNVGSFQYSHVRNHNSSTNYRHNSQTESYCEAKGCWKDDGGYHKREHY